MAYYNGKEIFFGAKAIGAGSAASENSVLYAPQELTTDQKEQAQKNIGTNTLIVTIDDSGRASHTPKQIISHVEGGGKALLLYNGNYFSLSHTDENHVFFSFFTDEFECVLIDIQPDGTLGINSVYLDLVVDDELDVESTNPVQNKVVTEAISGVQGMVGNIVTTGKNIIDPSKVIDAGNGDLSDQDGELISGDSWIFGDYQLIEGETYTLSKVRGNLFLVFYNADGSYAGLPNRKLVTTNTFTFVAPTPILKIQAYTDIATLDFQIELGGTATAYEPYGFTLNEGITIPAIGTGELSTEAKTLIGAVNELHDAMSNATDTPDAEVQELSAAVFEMEKVMPRLNEAITEWTDGIIGGDGTIGEAGEYGYAYSNKVLLLAGETYYVSGLLIGHTAYYDLDGNFLGRGSAYAGAIGTTTTDLRTGTIAIGDSDVYAVFQSLPASRASAYISRFVDKKASMGINGDMLLNKHLMDKKVLIFGDSITTGDTSEKIHYEKYGGYNKWVEALIESNYFAENNVRNDSIHATGFVSRFQGEDDLISRMRKVKDTDYDLVIVFAGINDSLRANTVEIGFGMDEQGNKQTDITKYFVPAVDTFFAELVEKFVDARICVVLPLRTRYEYAGHNVSSAATLLIGETSRKETEYADYIKTVAEEYCLPVLDATRHSGFSPRSGSAFANRWVNLWTDPADGAVHPDGVHPNEEYCYKYLAPYIRGFIDGLI